MAAKSGTPYENLTQVIFQSLVDQNEVRNVEVQHDVQLPGKGNASHQIDVYWKFERGGIEYETIVQAKDWNKAVDQGELLKFNGVLLDLPRRMTGVFVSREGYQQGAKDYALANGIFIYELNEVAPPSGLYMHPGDWANFAIIRLPLRGIITTPGETVAAEDNFYGLGYNIHFYTPAYSNPKFDISVKWLQAEYPTTDTSQLKRFDFSPGRLHEQKLYDADGTVIGNVADLFQKLAKAAHKEGPLETTAKHVFEVPTFILISSSLTPRIKVDAVSFDVKIQCRNEAVTMHFEQFPQWVLRQINSGSVERFGVTPAAAAQFPSKRLSIGPPKARPSQK
ncbi:MAG TPA: restriction endonuclease [Candidatus Acidoferrales bacterium]